MNRCIHHREVVIKVDPINLIISKYLIDTRNNIIMCGKTCISAVFAVSKSVRIDPGMYGQPLFMSDIYHDLKRIISGICPHQHLCTPGIDLGRIYRIIMRSYMHYQRIAACTQDIVCYSFKSLGKRIFIFALKIFLPVAKRKPDSSDFSIYAA